MITSNNANESQYKRNNHDHDHSDDSNPNTANEAFVIRRFRAKTISQRVRERIFIGPQRQLTRAEVLCDTRQWFV